MSFINNAHPGSQINLLCLVFRTLFENPGKYGVEELKNYCAPERIFSSNDHKKRFADNLSFWMDGPIKMWGLDENNLLTLRTDDKLVGSKPTDVAHHLRKALMKVKFTDILAERDEYGASKAIRTFAYILTQDKFSIFRTALNKSSLDSSFANNFAQYSLNDSEKSYFIEFCNFLGISEKVGAEDYVDPTRMISSFLSDLFEENTDLAASNFIQKLSSLVPIIDFGEHNTVVRNAIGSNLSRPNDLSINLSHALYRLNLDQVIKFSRISDDANPVVLNLPDGRTESISTVTYTHGIK